MRKKAERPSRMSGKVNILTVSFIPWGVEAGRVGDEII
jgi:hypothetical protein